MNNSTKKANVIVIGNSGVGKSTLINSIFGNREEPELAETGKGEGITQKMDIYENDEIGFRIIDTKGLEYTWVEQRKIRKQLKKWTKNCKMEENKSRQINAIWYCFDGNSGRSFADNIDTFYKILKVWKDVPLIAVITKSYFEQDDESNINMIRSTFEKKHKFNLKEIIPVVALSKDENCPSRNVDLLIEKTNALCPEGLQLGQDALTAFKLKQKRVMAQTFVGVCATPAIVIGAVPIPTPDAPIITAIETGMIIGIGKIYGIPIGKDDKTGIIKAILSAGTVSLVAKTIANALKAIPNIAGSVINAVVAGAIVISLGESVIYLMEAINNGTIEQTNVNKINEFIRNTLNTTVFEKINKYFEKNKKDISKMNVKEIIGSLIKYLKKS